MPRTDENGRRVEPLLPYLCNRTSIPVKEFYEALGISRATFYNRCEEETFPNAEECRLLAEHFDLNPIDLMLRFGLVEQKHVEDCLE